MKKANAPTLMLLLIASFLLSSCTSLQSNRLMSWDEYVRQPRNNPYVLEMDYREGSLLYYGAFHKVDPSHPQFEDIEQKWENFNPTLVYCEGNIWPLEETRRTAIEKYGEQGLITYLAARDGIQIECIDPSLQSQAIYLKKYFPTHLIIIYYVLRQAAVDRMMKKDFSASRCFKRYHRKLSHIYGQNSSPTSVRAFGSLVSSLFPNLVEWRDIPYSYFRNPESGGFLTVIHQKLNKYRDRTMIKKVASALKKGKRVFAIVGRSHVVIQEAILKSLL
jgi:hypothetical protein